MEELHEDIFNLIIDQLIVINFLKFRVVSLTIWKKCLFIEMATGSKVIRVKDCTHNCINEYTTVEGHYYDFLFRICKTVTDVKIDYSFSKGYLGCLYLKNKWRVIPGILIDEPMIYETIDIEEVDDLTIPIFDADEPSFSYQCFELKSSIVNKLLLKYSKYDRYDQTNFKEDILDILLKNYNPVTNLRDYFVIYIDYDTEGSSRVASAKHYYEEIYYYKTMTIDELVIFQSFSLDERIRVIKRSFSH
jgi:hypothetical protein